MHTYQQALSAKKSTGNPRPCRFSLERKGSWSLTHCRHLNLSLDKEEMTRIRRTRIEGSNDAQCTASLNCNCSILFCLFFLSTLFMSCPDLLTIRHQCLVVQLYEVVHERSGIMHCVAPKNHLHPPTLLLLVELSHAAGLCVTRPSHHEHDEVLWPHGRGLLLPQDLELVFP
mmetsp:Transcript_5721/g.20129  ORF Transcript_5721/g.20129 Transcript_5721/m.20129 type:complete len:172 (+) Transcript_5721:1459-1974(+)